MEDLENVKLLSGVKEYPESVDFNCGRTAAKNPDGSYYVSNWCNEHDPSIDRSGGSGVEGD